MTTKNPFTTVPQLAELEGCTPEAILDKIRVRKMKPLKVGGSFLLTDDDVALIRQPMKKGQAKGTKRKPYKARNVHYVIARAANFETSGDIRASESLSESDT
jgi:hypothetical protein